MEPANGAVRARLPRVAGHASKTSVASTLKDEEQFNTFFRLTSPSLVAQLRESSPDLPEEPDAKTVFLKLRELRNRW
ncbi:hydroxyacylglutathione hydrolase C-terminal domain-containing protein [Polaromonas jejuensis]|uniref:Hydroxyacylglutathione hydrolase C-terminal domain-containing protein n=1 Tax=Polaromonas jejuensis TaxID=457502 RepID=A0ABW0Q4A4_9BURK|nr:hydroxyacylglutathione hydrolase C-terminal domain-containing protein [Polaromonas jejuensis]